MECRSRPTGFVEILFGYVCGGVGGGVGVTLAVKGLLFFLSREGRVKARGQQSVPAAVFAA